MIDAWRWGPPIFLKTRYDWTTRPDSQTWLAERPVTHLLCMKTRRRDYISLRHAPHSNAICQSVEEGRDVMVWGFRLADRLLRRGEMSGIEYLQGQTAAWRQSHCAPKPVYWICRWHTAAPLSLYSHSSHSCSAQESRNPVVSIILPDITTLFISVVTYTIICFVLTTALCTTATTPEFVLY